MTHQYKFSSEDFKKSLLDLAQSINIPEGQAEEIADLALSAVASWLRSRHTVTDQDIRRVTTNKLNKLHPDLAYIYSNDGYII